MSDRSPAGRRLTVLTAAAVVSIAIAVTYVRLKLLRAGLDPTDPASGDLVTYYYPMLRWGFGELARGRLPLWNAHQSAGTPFLGNPQLGFFYPMYAPFLVLPADVAVTVDICLHLAIAMFTMFLLCRHAGMGILASLLGGAAYAFSGGVAIKVDFPNFLAPVAWAPLVFVLADRVLSSRSRRAAAGLAAVVALMLLGGMLQFVYLTALAAIPFVVARGVAVLWQDGFSAGRRAATLLLAAAACGLLVASVRVVPAAEYTRDSWRAPGTLTFEQAAVMSVPPRVLSANLLSPLPGSDIQREAYVGILPLVLAGVGLLLRRPRSVTLSIAVAGVGAALYALGSRAPVFPVLFHLPAGNWFRGPDRALFVTGLAVAFLAAGGVDELGRRGIRARGRGTAAAALAVMLAAVLGGALLLRAPGLGALVAYCAAGALAASCLLLAGSRAAVRHIAMMALLLLTAIDLFSGQRPAGALPERLRPYFARYEPFFADLRARQGLDRTYVSAGFMSQRLRFHSDLAKAGLNHGIWMATDYEAVCDLRQDRWLRFLGDVGEVPTSVCYFVLPLDAATRPFLRLAGVRFYLVADDENPPSPDVLAPWVPIRRADGVSLYEDPQALPRAFIVGRVEVETDPDRVLTRMRSVDLSRTAVVEEPVPASSTFGGGHATIARYDPDRVTVRTASDTGGLLVLTDRWFPGWQATLDGRPAAILRTDYLYRGVVIPAGEHVVEFVYRPRSFLLGALGSVLGLLGVCLLAAGRGGERT